MIKKIRTLINGILICLLFQATNVQAATVSFNESTVSSGLGNIITLDISGSGFNQVLDGGGVNLLFDASVLAVNSVSVDTGTWDFFDSVGSIDNTGGTVSHILFASFADITGDFSIASIEFLAIGLGTTNLNLTESNLNTFASGGQPYPLVTFETSSITVVPLPAAFWLLLSGLGVLRGMRKNVR